MPVKMAWRCLYCVTFVALTLHVLLTHYNSAHRNDMNFHISCPIDNCHKEFNKANSYSKHVRVSHRSHLFSTCCSGSPDQVQNNSEGTHKLYLNNLMLNYLCLTLMSVLLKQIKFVVGPTTGVLGIDLVVLMPFKIVIQL